MRKLDFGVLILGIFVAAGWSIFSGRNGFETDSAVIVARSISIASTINGKVVSSGPEVGAKVSTDDLLLKIEDGRIDRGRLAELQSEQAFLLREISNVAAGSTKLNALRDQFQKRSSAYNAWATKDLRLRKNVMERNLDAAVQRNKLDVDAIARTETLFQKNAVSKATLDTAAIKAEISRNQAEASNIELSRANFHAESIGTGGPFLEGGDTTYWEKMIDAIDLKLLDNNSTLLTLKAELSRAQAQAEVEIARIDSSFTEEHRATTSGIVNAVFVNRGSRVAGGTPLFQILDCAHPIIIVPLPEQRIGEFSIGQNVTIYPVDSDETLTGRIQYISSGPLIGQDKTIAVQQEITLQGNRAIVAFDRDFNTENTLENCDPTRLAKAVIRTETLFDQLVVTLGPTAAKVSIHTEALIDNLVGSLKPASTDQPDSVIQEMPSQSITNEN